MSACGSWLLHWAAQWLALRFFMVSATHSTWRPRMTRAVWCTCPLVILCGRCWLGLSSRSTRRPSPPPAFCWWLPCSSQRTPPSWKRPRQFSCRRSANINILRVNETFVLFLSLFFGYAITFQICSIFKINYKQNHTWMISIFNFVYIKRIISAHSLIFYFFELNHQCAT